MSLWRYLIVKIGRWKFLETATWLKGNRYLQGSKESLNIDEEESSKNAGRGEGFRRRERTHGGRKKKGSQRKGPAIAFFSSPFSLPLSLEDTDNGRHYGNFSPLLFSLCYRIMLEAKRGEKKMILSSGYLFILRHSS